MADQPNIVSIACPVCGASRFEGPGPAPGPKDILTCQSCGTKLSYGFLQARSPQAPVARRAEAASPRRKKAKAKRSRRAASQK